MCCQTEREIADPVCYLSRILSQYVDTWPTSPSTDVIMPGTQQGSHKSTSFHSLLSSSSSFSSALPARSLGFTILGEIFAYVTVF